PVICRLEEAEKNGILYNINGKTNAKEKIQIPKVELSYTPIAPKIYTEKINAVIEELKKGNTFLLNLTFPTPISCNLSLKEIFYASNAPYKLFFEDEFVVFSPESFIQIKENQVLTFPMKGTIDANVQNAEQMLLNNEKEAWEHHTIVDLMRNDLSIISKKVKVERFRYLEKITTHKGKILQTSSAISGTLSDDWASDFGQNLLKLLPAGSISGAPKKKTLEIIQSVEGIPRGYYTGVFGLFDGEKLDSAVAIRFIEKQNGQLYFKSGGGITAYSNPQKEYQELIQKIYLPIQNG
ncbi:MAG: aminodeoxychorismate synthase component I, partial [Weeksellaceae bacterium]|nr:aminodeoxychorismate synthase component I [Weeksellaceae bacterium]